MKLILDAQKEFVSEAANEPGFNPQMSNGEFKLNFQFEGFVTKLKEIGESFKQYANESPMGKAIASSFEGGKDENALSGFLEGLGLEGLAQKYVAGRQYEREKGEYVSNFMDTNPAAQILTEETARQAAEEEFNLKRTGQMPMPTNTVDPMGKEQMLETAEKDEEKQQVAMQSFKDLETLKNLSEKNLPMLEDIKLLQTEMLAVLTYIANEGLGGGGVGMDIPTGGDKKGGKTPKKGGGKGIGGKILNGAKGIFSGMGGKAIPIIGTALTVGSAGYDIYDREKQVDAGTMDREVASKENTKDVVGTGTGLAGAAAGAKLGLLAGAATGPAAPVAAPVLSLIGGIAGFFLGDKLGRSATEAVQNSTQGQINETDLGVSDPMGNISAPSMESSVPVQSSTNALDKGTGGGVEINQSNNSQVNAPTTVINNNIKQMKSPRNEDPTFNRYTQQRAYP